MSAEDIRTSSDSEDEAIQDAIDDDDDVRYSLRSRSVTKAQDTSVKTSTGSSGVIIEETRVSVNAGVRTTDAQPPTSRASMYAPLGLRSPRRSARCAAQAEHRDFRCLVTYS